MSNKFILSDKIWSEHEIKVKLADDVISVSNVKEFIKLLKDEYMKYRDSFRTLEDYYRIFDDIDKLAGKKLI
jgi:hypothetical protein